MAKKEDKEHMVEHYLASLGRGIERHISCPRQFEVRIIDDSRAEAIDIANMIETIFPRIAAKAKDIAIRCKRDGEVVLGIYTREVAETKMLDVMNAISGTGSAFKCIMTVKEDY